jgi:hypothetical protein
MSDATRPTYRSYLVRCWQEQGPTSTQAAVWRFSLTIIAEKQTDYGFSDLAALVEFVQSELGITEPRKEVSDELSGVNETADFDAKN